MAVEMTWEEFDRIVARLGELSREKPASYRFRVFLLALLGYAYLLAVLCLLIGCIGAIIWITLTSRTNVALLWKVLLPVAALTGVVLRSLWVRIEAPEGRELNREQCGQLFQIVDEFRRKLKGPSIHTALITEDFNAGISQVPRLGMFGWHKNYLTLGLPLMQALGPDQFRAVLAHEFGHLSGSHGKFGAWIYRVRLTWHQLMDALEQRESAALKIFSYFFEWYTPFFAAYSFVLARAQEYEADQAAAQLAGARTVADALISLDVADAFLTTTFWPGVFRKADSEPVPHGTPFADLQVAFRSHPQAGGAQKGLALALKRKTASGDTHPALADRLQALGQEAVAPSPAPVSAAEYFFGESLAGLTAEADRKWVNAVSYPWRERNKAAREAERRIAELDAKGPRDVLSDDEIWERAMLTEQFRETEPVMPWYEEILRRHPDHAGAIFVIGRQMLADDQDEGINFIERAMKLDIQTIAPGCQLIYDYLVAHDREEEAADYQSRVSEHAKLFALAAQERSALGPNDRYLPHELSPAVVQDLAKELSLFNQIEEAYLVRKEVKYFSDSPLYALIVQPKRAWYSTEAPEVDARLCQEISNKVNLPGDTLIMAASGQGGRLRDLIIPIPDSLIYRADKQ
jgi:Zn-dependent protease with chaperone function